MRSIFEGHRIDDLRDWLQTKFPLEEEMSRTNSAVAIDAAAHEAEVAAVFSRFDASKEGSITPEELEGMLHALVTVF